MMRGSGEKRREAQGCGRPAVMIWKRIYSWALGIYIGTPSFRLSSSTIQFGTAMGNAEGIVTRRNSEALISRGGIGG